MSVSKKVKQIVLGFEEGKILTYRDFSSLENFNAVALTLSRMVKQGEIQRLKKGQFFRPRKGLFGKGRPKESEIMNSLSRDGYISGTGAYNQLGLTTQVPNEIIIVGKKYNKRVQIGNLLIRYQKRDGDFPAEDRRYFQLLDALQDVKKIPGTSVDDAISRIFIIISSMKKREQNKLVGYAMDRKPVVRALVGAIMEELGSRRCLDLKKTLNPFTSYRIGIIESILSNKDKWRLS